MSKFCWLIEAPGPTYLGVQNLRNFSNLIWTKDHDAAIRFETEAQATSMNEALRTLDRTVNKRELYAFEGTLGPARAVEHGWLDGPEPGTGTYSRLAAGR